MSMWSEITSFAWAASREKISSGVRTHRSVLSQVVLLGLLQERKFLAG